MKKIIFLLLTVSAMRSNAQTFSFGGGIGRNQKLTRVVQISMVYDNPMFALTGGFICHATVQATDGNYFNLEAGKSWRLVNDLKIFPHAGMAYKVADNDTKLKVNGWKFIAGIEASQKVYPRIYEGTGALFTNLSYCDQKFFVTIGMRLYLFDKEE